VERYTIVPRTLIFLTRGDEILLLKGAPDKRLWAGLYNGIGGHIEQGEDVLSAARRELLEEAGLTPTNLRLCGTITINTGQDPGIGIYVFRGICPQSEIIPSREGTLEWAPISKISQMRLVEDLYQLIPRMLSMQPGEQPFSAHYSYDEQGKMIIKFTE
jgi:8-oxo-dGTP diphosphatase